MKDINFFNYLRLSILIGIISGLVVSIASYAAGTIIELPYLFTLFAVALIWFAGVMLITVMIEEQIIKRKK